MPSVGSGTMTMGRLLMVTGMVALLSALGIIFTVTKVTCVRLLLPMWLLICLLAFPLTRSIPARTPPFPWPYTFRFQSNVVPKVE